MLVVGINNRYPSIRRFQDMFKDLRQSASPSQISSLLNILNIIYPKGGNTMIDLNCDGWVDDMTDNRHG